MKFFKFTTDKTTKQLRWLMVGVTFLDRFFTLLGQPSTYWQHPETAHELNQDVYKFLSRGLSIYFLESLVGILFLFFIVSIISRKIALIVIFSVILNHYFGASSWLCYHWHFGIDGPLIYGIILSVVMVLLIFPMTSKVSPEKLLSNEPDT